jgi:CRP-like cAMP-binding protein
MSDNADPAFDVEAFLARADGGKTVRDYAKGEVVFSQGDPADAVFYIQRDQVSFRVVSAQGKEAIVAPLQAGSFFGEACLARQRLRTATAVTVEECRITRLERATILGLIHDEPEFSEKFIAHLLESSIRVQADLVDQLFNPSEKRLARLLLLLANFGKEGKPEPMIAQISQETLAQRVGTTRARVSYFMNRFLDFGFIDYNGGIVVHSSLLNVVLHDQPEIPLSQPDSET